MYTLFLPRQPYHTVYGVTLVVSNPKDNICTMCTFIHWAKENLLFDIEVLTQYCTVPFFLCFRATYFSTGPTTVRIWGKL
jgi:hypothetical protein